ncbi:MAG: hypothetical protein JG765_2092 [Cereibacter sp.]|jgi:hypothetical protein|nr:hypothetical protein [Cereibacter sp.]
MNYNNEKYQNKISKTNIAIHNSNWIIAKMLCHMKDMTEIDTRTIFITVHVKNITNVNFVAGCLYQLAESYLAYNLDEYIPLHRRPALAWCADFEGTTKVRGAVSPNRPHFHAALIVPKSSIARIPSLIRHLEKHIRSVYGVASFVGGSTPVYIRPYDHSKKSNSFNQSAMHPYADFIGYITKAELELSTSNQNSNVIVNSHVLPYDEFYEGEKSDLEPTVNIITKNVSTLQRLFKHFRYV